MVAIDRVGNVYHSVHHQEMHKLAQKPAPLATPTQYSSVGFNEQVANVMKSDALQKVTPEQFGLTSNPSLQFSTPGGGFVQVFGPLKTSGNDKFFHDPNPVVIQKKSKPITYVQKINLAYYNPPAPPAPGPIIIKEVCTTINSFLYIYINSILLRFVHHKLHHHHHSMFVFNHHHHQNKHQ
jgi:hypothetical protein